MTESGKRETNPGNKLSFGAIVVIAANTMNGPGLVTLPASAASAGEVTYCVLVVVSAVVTSFVVHRLCEVIWKRTKLLHLHGDQHEHDHQYAPKLNECDIVALSDRFFQKKKSASLAMVFCYLSLALAQMMLCAAIADSMLIASRGQSCGLAISGLHCASGLSMKPFQNLKDGPVSLISSGLVISSSITISLAAVDLDSMLFVQFTLFGCLLAACARFCWTLVRAMETPIASVGAPFEIEQNTTNTVAETVDIWIGRHPFDAVGPVLFNFAFVVTVPPLSCGAGTCQGASRALTTACFIMGVLYTLVGCLGAPAASSRTHNEMDNNLLSLVLRGTGEDDESLSLPEPMDVGAVVLFGLSQLAAIPVYCEMARETLVLHLNFSNKRHAFVVSHVFPWAVVALTYNSALFEAFVEWSSLLLLGFANFSLPLLLDHQYTSHHRTPGTGTDAVLCGFALITASISAVIVQRLTESLFLAEGTFMVVTLMILHYS